MHEIANLWKEDTDENIVKSWLIGLTDGATYSINEHFLAKLDVPDGMFDFADIEREWDSIIGPCIRCHIDDEILEVKAKEIVKGLNDFIDRINENPEQYFEQKTYSTEIDCDDILDRISVAIDGCFGSVEATKGTIYIDEGGKLFAVSVTECDPCDPCED